MSHSVCCQCGRVILTEELRTMEKSLCPECGNKYFTMKSQSTVQFLPNNSTKIQQRDQYYRSEKKLRREHFVGMEENKEGTLVIKERLIDKDSDVYYEFVRNSDTGEVVRQCHQKLSDHTNRGSAKKA